MKGLTIILVIIVVLAIGGYLYSKKVLSKFNWGSPSLAGADLKNIFNSGGFANITLTDIVTNNNNFKVTVNNLYIEIYYQGSVIAKSTTPHDPFVIPANGSVTITQDMTVAINNSLTIAAQLISGNKIEFDYKIKAIIFGFYPLIYNGKFTY